MDAGWLQGISYLTALVACANWLRFGHGRGVLFVQRHKCFKFLIWACVVYVFVRSLPPFFSFYNIIIRSSIVRSRKKNTNICKSLSD
jgi:hypothetical protein